MGKDMLVGAFLAAGCVGVVKPFFDMASWKIFKSGMLSPFYVDGRKLWADPWGRQVALQELINVARTECGRGVVLVGMATGGIPPAAMAAQEGSMPFAYIRGVEKGHGTSKLIEGMDVRGRNVLLVEDVVTLATTSLPAIRVLRKAGAEVAGCFSFFTYAFPQTIEGFRKEGVKFFFSTSLDSVVVEMGSRGMLQPDEAEYLLKDWREAPPMKEGIPPLW